MQYAYRDLGSIPTRGPKQYVISSLVQPTVLSIKAKQGTMITIIIVKCKPLTNKHLHINTLISTQCIQAGNVPESSVSFIRFHDNSSLDLQQFIDA